MDKIKINVTIYENGQMIGGSMYEVEAPFAIGLDLKTLGKAIEEFAGSLQLDGEVCMSGRNDF